MDSDLRMVEIERLGDSLWVLELAGEHDLSTAPRIAAAFDRITETGTTVVVDLSEASFIDSTVIRTLLGSMERGEDLLLVVPAPGAVEQGAGTDGSVDVASRVRDARSGVASGSADGSTGHSDALGARAGWG